MWQVLATGLVPALICVLQPLFPSVAGEDAASSAVSSSWFGFLSAAPVRPLWFLTYLAYVSTCCGDTLASEIGMLSSQQPLMLWRRARVARGVDGGMTLLGTAASVAGGAMVGACAGTGFDLYAGAVYGCIGSLFDSLLGTLLQSMQYRDFDSARVSAAAASRDGFVDATAHAQPLPLSPAVWKQLNNVVNVLSSLLAAALAVAVQQAALEWNLQLMPLLALICALVLLTVVPGMQRMYALAACCLLTLLWNILYGAALPRERHGAACIVVAYCAWRISF